MSLLNKDGWIFGKNKIKYNLDLELIECTKCKEIKPFSSFNISARTMTGRKYQCISCNSTHKPITIGGLIFIPTTKGTYFNEEKELQLCNRCDTVKPYSEYTDKKNAVLKRMQHCKRCTADKVAKRISTNSESRDKKRVSTIKYSKSKKGRDKKASYIKNNPAKISHSNIVNSRRSRAEANSQHSLSLLQARFKRSEGESISRDDIPVSLVIIMSSLTILKRVITLKLNKMDKDTKKVKAVVEVVKNAFKPVQFDQFHDAKKLNTILMSTLERLTEPEPTVTVGEAMAVAKLADMMIKNTLVELKKQQVATLITHVGVSQRTISV